MLTAEEYISVGFTIDDQNDRLLSFILSETAMDDPKGYHQRKLFVWLGKHPSLTLMVANKSSCEILETVKIDLPTTVRQLKSLIFGLGGVEIP